MMNKAMNHNTDTKRENTESFQKDGIQRYLEQIGKIPLLSAKEEQELGKIIKEGGPDASLAIKKLVESNLRLVVHYAKRYMGQGMDLEDLVSNGVSGLYKAAEKYDYTKNCRFSTYASFWIKQALLRGRDTEVFGSKYKRVSLDEKIGEDEDTTLSELIADENADDPCDEAIKVKLREDVQTAFSILDARERRVLSLLYGIGEPNSLTLEEISELPEFGISRERVRQIKNKAIYKIQHSTKMMNLLEDHVR